MPSFCDRHETRADLTLLKFSFQGRQVTPLRLQNAAG
jgi:hypothetical protein